MKIESIRIENFRCFKDETILMDDYTCLVGANGVGKSTVLHALNVFFRQSKDCQTNLTTLTEDDFHHKNTSKPIRISVTFKDLSNKAKEDLKDYVRLDKLVVTAVATYYNSTEKAEVEQHGNRMVIKEFAIYFERDKEKANSPELKEIYFTLREKYPELPKVSTKTDMAKALRDYESNRPKECSLKESSDQFYGISKGVNRLAPHIQWVFIPGTKDVTEESEESKASALGQLLERTVRSKVNFTEKINSMKRDVRDDYQKLLDEEQNALDSISQSLRKRLADLSHPNISAQVLWKQDPDKSIKIEEPRACIRIGERGFEADLARFGHGLQRSYMLALLQELAQTDDTDAPTLIMGIEEPELYQHPPQARYLAEALQELSLKNSQILLCTHSPLFVASNHFDSIRIFRENGKQSYTTISKTSYEEMAKMLKEIGAEKKLHRETGMIAKLYPSLNPVINEMFFCKVLVLVEGIEDVAFITSELLLTGRNSDFRKYGCHIVPANSKSNMIKPLAVAKCLKIPTFVVFDADTDKEKESEIVQHKKENKAILALQDHSSENEWPDNHIIKDNLVCWKTNIGKAIEEEIGADWCKYKTKANRHYDNAGNLSKNPLAVAKTLDLAYEEGIKSNLLLQLIERIIEFARESSLV